jgi:NAD(P) transhydrogenase subunit alpha
VAEEQNMLIGVPRETAAGETRGRRHAGNGEEAQGAGQHCPRRVGRGRGGERHRCRLCAAGAEIVDRATAFGSELVLKVRSPSAEELRLMKSGSALVGMLNPFDRPGLEALAAPA